MDVRAALSLILDLVDTCTPAQIQAIEWYTGSKPGDVARAIEALDEHLGRLCEPYPPPW